MRKFSKIGIFLLAVLLAGCAKSGVGETKIAEFYRGEGTFSAVLTATLDHGDYTTEYGLTHTFQKAEGHTLTVETPAVLAGLVVRAGEGLSLAYEGMLFAPGELAGTSVTPVKLLPALYCAWGMGVAQHVSLEKTAGGRVIVIDTFAKVEEEEFLFRTQFAEETLLPVKADVFFDGRRVMSCVYQSAKME